MSNWQDNCVPCVHCGVKPIVIDVAYGRNHSDLMCQCCGRRTDTDGKLKWAIKDWNEMNRQQYPPTEDTGEAD